MVILENLYIFTLIAYPSYIITKRDKVGVHKNKDIALVNFVVQSLRVSQNRLRTLDRLKTYKRNLNFDDVYKYIYTYYKVDKHFISIIDNLHSDLGKLLLNVYNLTSYKLQILNGNYLALCDDLTVRDICKKYTSEFVGFFEKNINDFLIREFLVNLTIENKSIDTNLREIVHFSNVSDPYSEDYIINSGFVPYIIRRCQPFLVDKSMSVFYYYFRRPCCMEVKFPLYEESSFYKFFNLYLESLEILNTNDKRYDVSDVNLDTLLHRFFYIKNARNCLKALVDHLLYVDYNVFFDIVKATRVDDDYVQYYFNFITRHRKKENVDIEHILQNSNDVVHVNITIANTKHKSENVPRIFADYMKSLYAERHNNGIRINTLSGIYNDYKKKKIRLKHNERLDIYSANETTNDYLRFLKHHFKKCCNITTFFSYNK